ncbi:MAG: ABC transporter ATP-binding protein [Chloroflexota bacterium]
MVKLDHVTKQYHDTTAVKNLSMQVDEGEIVGIIGHNGAGKSTALKMIAGLIKPTSGVVQVMGQDIQKDSARVKKQIGFLPEDSPLYENMTARQYLLFFSELYQMPRRAAVERIDLLLESLNLSQKDKLTGEFSKGMKRKTAIARALLHDPKLLILDEPSSGLDPLTSFFIINYMKTLKSQGKTILLSAHNLFHVEFVCDRVAMIKDGDLVVFDRMDAIRASLGRREYQVVFTAEEQLSFERNNGNYVFRSDDIGEIAALLEKVSENDWGLVDLSIHESALEEIYVKLMTTP